MRSTHLDPPRRLARARRSSRPFAALSCLALLLLGCHHQHDGDQPAHGGEAQAEPWSVTAWGERYEIFPEVEPLVAGQAAQSHTHVTSLADFSPLRAGTVAIVLRDAAGAEEVFSMSEAKRPGIFAIVLQPVASGEFDLLFRVDAAPGREEIPGGRVRVGDAAEPGGLVAAPRATLDAQAAAAAAGGEEVPFLKEQQWKTHFATAWSAPGELAATVLAPGRIVARPGGDRHVTAPADGIVRAAPFPYPGLAMQAGQPLFALTPRLDPERSLAALEGELAGAEAEHQLAVTEAERMRVLAREQIVAAADSQAAESRLAVAAARAEAARRDVATARRARGAESGGDGAAEALWVRAPFAGAVAEVLVSAGQAVEAGDELGRIVAGGAPWAEAWVAPEAAVGLAPGPTMVSLATTGGASSARWPELAARLAALAPALDAASGRRTLLLELAAPAAGLAVGQSVEIEIASGQREQGIVLPRSAVVDDAGINVVYVQLAGETMLRREVELVACAGQRCLVRGVSAGERVITTGGTAVRRSSLLASGVGEGHVH